MSDLVRNRSRQRVIHIVLAACLGTYLYSPLRGVAAVESVVQLIVFPGLAVSGLLLWRGPLLRQRIRRHRTEREH